MKAVLEEVMALLEGTAVPRIGPVRVQSERLTS
jgi:hypothetical protein